MFLKLPNIFSATSKVKVIVKAQSYQLKPFQTFEGRVHKEGDEEKIMAVGIYYYHVDPALTGGELELQVPLRYGCGNRGVGKHAVPVKSGSAVVFSNLEPYHRMTKLEYKPQDDNKNAPMAERKILSFFVLDASTPCKSSREVPVNVRTGYQKQITEVTPLQRELASIVCDYVCGSLEDVLINREELRSQRIESADLGQFIRGGMMD